MPASRRAGDLAQLAFQRAFRPELTRVVYRSLRAAGTRILDVPCGRGFYTELMARAWPTGRHLTAVDVSKDDVLALRKRLSRILPDRQFTVRAGNAYHLPFPDGSFDAIWCAESLISLRKDDAMTEFRRLLTPGGEITFLEVDEYHHVLLPWPVEVEAALPAALLRATKDQCGTGDGHSPARTLRADLKAAGFTRVRRRVHTFGRVAPFDREVTRFLRHHVRYLRAYAYPYLVPARQREFDRFVDDKRPDSLFRRKDAELTLLTTLHTAGNTRTAAVR
jgi:ubiquinone/menaquinone biosynthesis C-methylase UbiE